MAESKKMKHQTNQKQTLEIPALSMRATFSPETIDEKNRTVEMRWTTGAKVQRGFFDPFNEELSLNPGDVRLERMNSGAPLLNAHSSYNITDQLGVVVPGTTRLGPDGGFSKVKFSEREDVEPIWQDVKAGIVRNVSVGYKVYKYLDVTPSDDKVKTLRAVDWEPMELSLVPIGADAGATVRAAEKMNTCVIEKIETEKKENRMPEDIKTETPVTKAVAVDTDKIRKEAAVEASQKEKARISEITTLCRTHSLDEAFTTKLVDGDVTIEKARAAILDELATRTEKTKINSTVHMGRDITTDSRRQGMQEALIHRANPSFEQTDLAKQYRGKTLLDLARACIKSAGGNDDGLSKREVALAAFNLLHRAGMQSTSDFPEILANTVNRTLRSAYELAPRTFTPWARKTSAPDFKQISRTQLSELSAFGEVLQSGEYKTVTLSDAAEKYYLKKYGGIVPLTWEAIINDDMDAFGRIPLSIANEAAGNESDIVYGILSANAALADAVALFHATHANYTSSGTAITVASLGVGRAMMRKQTGPKGRILNLSPSYLIVGADKESEAYQYTSASYVPSAPSSINPAVNTSLKPIVEARITGNKWYLAGDPSRCDTVEYAYLEGEEGIYTETRQGFEVDGLQIKARQVFAAKAIDYRNLYYNVGA
jgi:hypothetical protein